MFYIIASPIYIPTNSVGGSIFPTASPGFVICRLFSNSNSDWYEVVLYCSFDLHFSMSDVEHLFFHVPIGHLYVFFGEMSL